jgi:adenylate cyclase
MALLLHWQVAPQSGTPLSAQTRLRIIRQRISELVAAYTPSYFPVAWKMGLVISLLVVLGMSLLGSIVIRSQVSSMQSQADTFGHAIASQFADSAREPLLAQDGFTLKVLVNNLTQGDGLLGAAVFDHNGKSLQSTGDIPPQTGQPITPLRRVWKVKGITLATYTAPIKAKNLVAGYVAISLSQRPINQAQQQAEHTIIIATLLMSLLIIMASFLVSSWLARPIQNLVSAAKALHAGDLHFRLHERRNDELGQLIESYNKMASGLLEKNQVEKVLSRFVSPSVAGKMMRDIDQIQLGGREVDATIIFADIAGFTRLSEKLTPDALAHLLNDYFNAISCASRFYRGTIDKYVGDCAMIVFGVPEEDSEHLYHGLCCALMAQRLIARVNEWRARQGHVTVNFRIGINSGKVLAGNLGSSDRMQYTVVGDTVNLASRLSDLAHANEVLLPLHLLGNSDIASRFRFHANNKDIRIRGKSETVTTALLEGMHPQLEAIMEQRVNQFMEQLEVSPPQVDARPS